MLVVLIWWEPYFARLRKYGLIFRGLVLFSKFFFPVGYAIQSSSVSEGVYYVRVFTVDWFEGLLISYAFKISYLSLYLFSSLFANIYSDQLFHDAKCFPSGLSKQLNFLKFSVSLEHNCL